MSRSVISTEENQTEESETQHERKIMLEVVAMACLLGITKFGYNNSKKYIPISESLFATIVGLLTGMVLYLTKNNKLILEIEASYVIVFLIVLLPPIIFESSFFMKRKEFIKHFGTILIFAVLGTILSTLFIGLLMWAIGMTKLFPNFTIRDGLAFGSIISATDPVCILSAFNELPADPNIFQIIFGESILNDAVSMVSYETFITIDYAHVNQKDVFIIIGKFLLGICISSIFGFILGYLTSLFLKFMAKYTKENLTLYESSVLIAIPWISYLVGNVIGLSGILIIFFNGFSQAIYTKPFILKQTKHFLREAFHLMASNFEIIVFIFIGMGFFSDLPYKSLTAELVILMIVITLLSRVVNVGICSLLSNFTRHSTRLTFKKQFFLWFAGVRGAMAYAISVKSRKDFPEMGSMFVLLTLIITAFTLIYSSLFIDLSMKKCGIVVQEPDKGRTISVMTINYIEGLDYKQLDCTNKFKFLIADFNEKKLMKWVMRHNENNTDHHTLTIGSNHDLHHHEISEHPENHDHPNGDVKKEELPLKSSLRKKPKEITDNNTEKEVNTYKRSKSVFFGPHVDFLSKTLKRENSKNQNDEDKNDQNK